MKLKLLLMFIFSSFVLVGCCDGEGIDWDDYFGMNYTEDIENELKVEKINKFQPETRIIS